MKLRRLDFVAFGPFTGAALDFGSGDGLSLVLGSNEAGKSSALRGLTQFLYGIPARSNDNFIHAYKDLEIRGVLDFDGAAPLELRRRKGTKNDLLVLPSLEPFAQERLTSRMGGVGEDAFRQVFGIDHRTLAIGGEEILKAGGALGQSLFAAASGIASLRDVLSGLDEAQKALFAPRATKNASINAAMGELDKLRRQQKELTAKPSDWKAVSATVRRLERRRGELQAQLDELTRELSRKERLRRALVPARGRVALLAELAALGDAPVLGPDFVSRRIAAVSGVSAARQDGQAARDKIAVLDAALAALRLEAALLQGAAQVEGLYTATAVHEKALRDARNLEIQRDGVAERAAVLLRGLRPDLTLERVEELRLSRQEQTRIRTLAGQGRELHAERRAAEREAQSTRRRLDEARRSLDALQAPGDTAALAGAVQRAVAAGDVQDRLETLRSQCAVLRSAVEAGAKALGLWTGPLEELAALAVPCDETLRRFAARRDALAVARGDAHRERERLERELADARAKLDALRRSGDVPAEADLVAARTLRDSGWSVVRARLDGTADSGAEKEFLQSAGAERLGQGFEECMRGADEVADRLRREAGRVAENAALGADIARTGAGLDAVAARLAVADAEGGALQGEWLRLWQPLGIQPLPPAEMLAWAASHREVRQRVEELRVRQAEAKRLASQVAALRDDLALQLRAGGTGAAADAGAEPALAVLIAQARHTLDAADALRQAHRDGARQVESLGRDVAEAGASLAQCLHGLDAWSKEWQVAVRPLGLHAEATADEAEAILDDVASLFGLVAELREKDKRVEHIRKDYAAFCADVHAAVGALAPDLAGTEPVRAARELNERLTRARAEAQRAELLAAQRAEAVQDRDAADRRLAGHEEALRLLCAEAGCAGADGLEEAEARAVARAAAAQRLETAEGQLAAAAAGADLEGFAAEALDQDPDRLAADTARLSAGRDAVKQELDAVLLELGGAQRDVAAMDGTSRAAQVAEQAQGVVGQVQEDLDRFVRLKLASLVISREIERYRKANQGPVLERAGGIFADLTCGSFAGLDPDFNERGEPVILGTRPDGVRVAVDAMSDGTRDQLFLALRLAGLHRYLDNNPPVPFIVDDILVNFDDGRAAATMAALAALAGRTQVVFFTHHAHLLPLAERVVPAGRLRVLRLGMV